MTKWWICWPRWMACPVMWIWKFEKTRWRAYLLPIWQRFQWQPMPMCSKLLRKLRNIEPRVKQKWMPYLREGISTLYYINPCSHGILTLFVDQSDKGDDENFSLKQSKLHMIDLAGSERAGSTQATGQRLKEGAKINQSMYIMLYFESCKVYLHWEMWSMHWQQTSHLSHIEIPNWHDCYKTGMLYECIMQLGSLGGNSVTLIIANISPASVNFEESLSTLYFADRYINYIIVTILVPNKSRTRFALLEIPNCKRLPSWWMKTRSYVRACSIWKSN